MRKERISFFDTTLRDGEQSPGAGLNAEKKARIAWQLEKLGVDTIEAGFPASSIEDFNSVREVSGIIGKAGVCALARCLEKDIQEAGKALKNAKKPRIHVFLATSPIHMQFKLCKTKEQVLRQAVNGVKQAMQYCDDVEFSPEDASRTEKEFLFQVIEKAIEAGAKTINIPDTVGYAVPEEYGLLIKEVKEKVPNINEAVISVHCHNDLGLAVANSLEAVKNGARQVECTINGIGERAGNASLEEIAMALNARNDFFRELTHSINTKEIMNASRMVEELTGLRVQRNKAIVGRNAFAHEAGIHQDGVIKKRQTYEIMNPEEIGLKESELVLGKHSGRAAIKARLECLGFKASENEINELFPEFKKLADWKKEVSDNELMALAGKGIKEFSGIFKSKAE